jgi:hypothetical protein
MYLPRTCVHFVEGLSIADMTCFLERLTPPFAQPCNRFPYLREELQSSLCPCCFLIFDKAALDLPIQVGKEYTEVLLIAAKRLRYDVPDSVAGHHPAVPENALAQGACVRAA